MAQNTLDVFETTVQKTNIWLSALCEELEIENRQEAYRVLRGVLHALRDELGVFEAAQLSAQLPMLVRGIFYEGWHPADSARVRTLEEFEHKIYLSHGARPQRRATEMIEGVLNVLRKYADPHQVEEILSHFPGRIRQAMTVKSTTLG
jgi:uncharacterized protein (DUF2267 family)